MVASLPTMRQSCKTDSALAAQAMGKLKRFKPVAMRCEKTADSYGAFVALACVLILVKSVHIT
jgi:hypothetical protein